MRARYLSCNTLLMSVSISTKQDMLSSRVKGTDTREGERNIRHVGN